MTDDYTRDPLAGAPIDAPARTSVLGSPSALDADGGTSSGTKGGGPGSPSAGAKEKAKNVAGAANEAAGSVLDEARSGASDVKQEAQDQIRNLWGQARSELSDQTGAQQQKLAAGVRSFSDQLDQMASAPEEQGLASHLARDLGSRADDLGRWLEDHGPDEVLEELRSFARRRPGAFLLAAAGAGLLVGRLTRALKDGSSSSGGSTSAGGSSSQATPASYDGTSAGSTSYGTTPAGSTSYEGTSYGTTSSGGMSPGGAPYADAPVTPATTPGGGL